MPEITDEMVERAAKAAWMDYKGLGSFEEYCDRIGEDANDWRVRDWFDNAIAEWPENTGVFPNADRFRSAARAALKAALS